MAHFHTDVERFDVHVVLEVCEIVIESANIDTRWIEISELDGLEPGRPRPAAPFGSA
jgi:hypothetical protein